MPGEPTGNMPVLQESKERRCATDRAAAHATDVSHVVRFHSLNARIATVRSFAVFATQDDSFGRVNKLRVRSLSNEFRFRLTRNAIRSRL
jgi:hypothetical protein